MRILKPLFKVAILALIVYALYAWVIMPYFFVNKAKVVHMFDPDSYFVMKDGVISKVQLIGVDAPESVGTGNLKVRECYGEEAKHETAKKFFAGSREVVLESDDEVGDKDVHGRDLRYLTLNDGTFLNEQLIRDGLARVYVPEDLTYKHKDKFIQAEEEAKNESRGIWSKENCVK